MYQEKQLSEQARIQMQKIVNDSLNETQKRLSASRNHEDELIHQNERRAQGRGAAQRPPRSRAGSQD